MNNNMSHNRLIQINGDNILHFLRRTIAFATALVFAVMPLAPHASAFASVGQKSCNHESMNNHKMAMDNSSHKSHMEHADHMNHMKHMDTPEIPVGKSMAKSGNQHKCNHGSKPCSAHRQGKCDAKMAGCMVSKCSSETSPEEVVQSYGLEMLIPSNLELAYKEKFIIINLGRLVISSLGISSLYRPPSN